jgi:hypothetical protein
VKILEQRLWHRTSGTSAYSHTYGNHDDSWNPVSSRDAEVDGFGQGSGNSATRRRVMVVIPVSYAALREATRERERQRAAARRRPVHQGGGRWRPWRRACGMCCASPPPGTPLYIVGRGCTLTPPPRHQEVAPKEEEKDGGVLGWGRPPPRNPNPSRL